MVLVYFIFMFYCTLLVFIFLILSIISTFGFYGRRKEIFGSALMVKGVWKYTFSVSVVEDVLHNLTPGDSSI